MRRSRTRWMWLLIAGLLSGWPTGPAGAHEGSGALDGRGGAYKTPPFTEPPSMDTRKPRIRRGPGHEVWRLDQSNTNGLAYGGTLYIYDGRQLRRHAATAVSERMDLGGATAALCLAKTGANPVRPHMLVFNVNDNTHAIVSFVASGHVVFFDAETRTPCADPCATPMRIVAEYDAATLPRSGCGFTEARGWVYGDGGDGNALNPDGWSVYRLPVGSRDVYNAGNPENTPAPQTIAHDDSVPRDAHGVARTRNEKYVWFFERAGNVAEIFRSVTGERAAVLNLVHPHLSLDPTPDLAGEAPDGKFVSCRTAGPGPSGDRPYQQRRRRRDPARRRPRHPGAAAAASRARPRRPGGSARRLRRRPAPARGLSARASARRGALGPRAGRRCRAPR